MGLLYEKLGKATNQCVLFFKEVWGLQNSKLKEPCTDDTIKWLGITISYIGGITAEISISNAQSMTGDNN